MRRYKITFEFADNDFFIDECEFEVYLENLFPNFENIKVEELS